MTRSGSITSFAGLAALALAAVALAGCGGGGSASASSAHPKTASGHPRDGRHREQRLGKILVSSHGRTLHLFQKDAGTTSACYGACPRTGRRFVRPASRPPEAGRTLRCSGRRSVRTERRRSPTTVTRSTSSAATRSPVTLTARASMPSAEARTRSQQQAIRSPARRRARAAATNARSQQPPSTLPSTKPMEAAGIEPASAARFREVAGGPGLSVG
jgi:Secreted repeat of unknown function